MLQQLLWNTRNQLSGIRSKLTDEDGIGVIEVILILLVLIGLVLIFKEQIIALARSIFTNIRNQADTV